MSDVAREAFAALRKEQPAPAGDHNAQRTHYDRINSARLDRARKLYDVAVTERQMAGVAVHDVTPAAGLSHLGTLLCLHGGAFIWGSGAGAVLEAVPVAALTGMRVLAVEYRLAPEHVFPAAVDDVLAVVRALRDDGDKPLAIYGCSAGAVLTAQVVARMINEGLCVPQAVAMLHGSGVEVGGDSLAVAGALNGDPREASIRRFHDLSYFAGSDAAGPLVFPGDHPAMLQAFPPTMLISGTRDFAASSVSVMHRRLLGSGVDARLILFDGMWHAHHVDVDLPEAQEAHAALAAFFREQLGAP